jgi:hypothetical protein
MMGKFSHRTAPVRQASFRGAYEQIDTYIQNIYYNSVHKGIVDGYFNMKRLRSHDYDLHFIDYIMPGSAGTNTISDLRIQYNWTVEYSM